MSNLTTIIIHQDKVTKLYYAVPMGDGFAGVYGEGENESKAIIDLKIRYQNQETAIGEPSDDE